jgi:hypothetical protein
VSWHGATPPGSGPSTAPGTGNAVGDGVCQSDPDRAPDSQFLPGELRHLVAATELLPGGGPFF